MMRRLFDQFNDSSLGFKMMAIAVAGVWILVLVALAVAALLFLERPGQALPPTTSAGGIPGIVLDPVAGPVSTSVTVRGQAWQPGDRVWIYLVAPDEAEPPAYASAAATVDREGRFVVDLVVPSRPDWDVAGFARVVARTAEGGTSSQALFGLISPPEQPTATAPVEPTPAPTETPLSPTLEPTPATLEPTVMTPTPEPGVPGGTATTQLNIRSGPGTAYPILGSLRPSQSVEITGVSSDGGWWQIRFAGSADGRGWVSASYVTAQNTEDVPTAQPPALPPTPEAISDWRGEYYANRDLAGLPALVRNDTQINFDWGAGAPAAGLPADNFSVRWTRELYFSAGTYRFYAHVDDGVRVWIDGDLIVDQWHDTSLSTYTADVDLNEGRRTLHIEYYEHTGSAVAQLAWERLEDYPDWRGEYFNNPNLSGPPVLVRNDANIDFYWPESPGPGVPADNFSARWTRTLYLPAYVYRFSLVVDDGARLWVDDELIIDAWRTGPPKGYTAELGLSEGLHSLRLEYFEFRYGAQVYLNVAPVQDGAAWKAEYFDNRSLRGKPVLKRDDGLIKFNWGTGSPGPGVPADNFSARWTRDVDLEAGTYRFSARVDDGVRLWVDDTLLIDSWQEGRYRLRQAEHRLSGGTHRVKVEYFERTGHAQVEVDWERKP